MMPLEHLYLRLGEEESLLSDSVHEVERLKSREQKRMDEACGMTEFHITLTPEEQQRIDDNTRERQSIEQELERARQNLHKQCLRMVEMFKQLDEARA